jgi:K+-transporting ATPase KdpF subunit
MNGGRVVLVRLPRAARGDAGLGAGLCRLGEKKMTAAHVVSGVLALALLVYLLVALIRAEDL